MLTLATIHQFVDSYLNLHIDDKMHKVLDNLLQVKLHDDGISKLDPFSPESSHVINIISSIDFTQSMTSICDNVMATKFKVIKEKEAKAAHVFQSLSELPTPPEFNHKYLEHLLMKYAVYKDHMVKAPEEIILPSKGPVSHEVILEPVQKDISAQSQGRQKESIISAFEEIKPLTEDGFFKWAQKIISTMNEQELKSFLSVLFNSFPKQELLLPYLRRTGDVEWKDESLFQIIFNMSDDSGLLKFKKEMTSSRLSLPTKKVKGKTIINHSALIPFDAEMYSHLTSCLMSKDQLIELNHTLRTLGVPKSDHISYILKMGLSLEPEQYDSCIDLLSRVAICQGQFKKADKKVKMYEGGLHKQRLFGNSKTLIQESKDRQKVEKLHKHLTFELGKLTRILFEKYGLTI